MSAHLRNKIIKVKKLMFTLKISKPKDYVITVRDCHAKTLKKVFDEIWSPAACYSKSSGIVGGQREADMDFEGWQMKIIVKIFFALGAEMKQCQFSSMFVAKGSIIINYSETNGWDNTRMYRVS